MLLALNIGNSRISVGIFDSNGTISLKFKISTDIKKTSDEYCTLIRSIIKEQGITTDKIDASIISSVVPQLTSTLTESVKKITETTPLVVGPGVKTGFSIKIDSPAELGSDIVANAAAVIQESKKEKKPSIIVDMNTVTTVSAINENGEYIGCCIFPGVQMSFDSMRINTAMLPNVTTYAPKRAVGKNSQDSVRSGVLYGNAIMLDGFIYRFAKEMKCKHDEMCLIITGEYAKCILDLCSHKFVFDEDLTLKGLYCIYLNNIQ